MSLIGRLETTIRIGVPRGRNREAPRSSPSSAVAGVRGGYSVDTPRDVNATITEIDRHQSWPRPERRLRRPRPSFRGETRREERAIPPPRFPPDRGLEPGAAGRIAKEAGHASWQIDQVVSPFEPLSDAVAHVEQPPRSGRAVLPSRGRLSRAPRARQLWWPARMSCQIRAEATPSTSARGASKRAGELVPPTRSGTCPRRPCRAP